MPRKRPTYPPEFRHQMVELVRSGRSIRETARDFKCSEQTIRNWLRQADLDEGRRDDGLTTAERNELRRFRRKNRQLRLEREILAKSHGLVRSGDRLGARKVFEFMRANQARFPIAKVAHLLGVSLSGYYAWRDRDPSPRKQYDAVLKARISNIHHQSRGTYGAPRIHTELAADGIRIGRKRVARLMREMALAGVSAQGNAHHAPRPRASSGTGPRPARIRSGCA